MVRFTEKHHAFISARYFARLKESGIANYKDIYLFAVRLYGEQRGRRMAARALRDGRPLDMASYRYYGEWSFTPEFTSTAGEFFRETERGERYAYEVYDCPWNRVYQEQGLPDGALLYCQDLDRSICRGFSPKLRYEVERFADRSMLCHQVQYDAKLDKDADFPPADPENKRSFNYHCGHVFSVFRTEMKNCLGAKGDGITAGVLKDFEAAFGKEAGEVLIASAEADFERI